MRDINARLLSIKGNRTVQSFAKELGKILKRQPWRIFGHPDDEAGRAPPARRGGDGGDGGGHDDDR